MRRRLLVQAIGLAAALAALPLPAAAQTADEVFDAQVLHEMRLLINSKDLQLLRANFTANTYYPADLTWGAQRVRNIGVRSRGAGSRNGVKLGLRIDFDRYTTDQRFAGLSSLVLDNLVQDASMVRERVAMAFLNRVGVPAPRESFTRLFINNEYQGVYAIVEEIEPAFVARTLGEDTGYLFEYHWISAFRGEDLGTIAAYKPLFEPRNHESDADGVLYGAIGDLFREAATSDATTRERIERFLDVPAFVTLVAVENFLAENDGVLGYAGMNNLYVYRPAGSTRHRLLPWDKDNTFLQIDFPILNRLDDNVLSAAARVRGSAGALLRHARSMRALRRGGGLAAQRDHAVDRARRRRGAPGHAQVHEQRGVRRRRRVHEGVRGRAPGVRPRLARGIALTAGVLTAKDTRAHRSQPPSAGMDNRPRTPGRRPHPPPAPPARRSPAGGR